MVKQKYTEAKKRYTDIFYFGDLSNKEIKGSGCIILDCGVETVVLVLLIRKYEKNTQNCKTK